MNKSLIVTSTVRLQFPIDTSYGTGFWFRATTPKGAPYIALVTNRHVPRKGTCILYLTRQIPGKGPQFGNYQELKLDNLDWYAHPTEDLAVTFFDPSYFEHYKKITGFELYFNAFTADNIIPLNDMNFEPIEEILMSGYPVGLIDGINLFPITRKGITATPVSMNFDGTNTFLIDVSIFPGCSGSPVVTIKNSKVLLLGIAYLSIHQTKNGIPLNLGAVIKSNIIAQFLADLTAKK